MKVESKDKNIQGKILWMILPITIENILQMVSGTVSMAFIGRTNPIAVGAVGLSNLIFRIVWSSFRGLGVGSSGYVAQAYGGDRRENIIYVAKYGLAIVFILSVIAQQFIFWNTETILKIFNPSSELLNSAVLYLRIISWSLPLAAVILFIAGILQGMGNAKTPMITVSILNAINILLGYLLIFGKFKFPELGLRGAGHAYNLAHLVAGIVALYTLWTNMKGLRESIAEYTREPGFDEIIELIRYGLPTSFELSFWQISSIFITRAILVYGETTYAAYQLGLQAEAISYMPATGLGIAATAFVGEAFGSQDKELGQAYMKELTKLTLIINLVTGGIFVFFPKVVMRALTNDLELIKIGSAYLFVMGLSQMPQNLSGLYNGALRGAGFPMAPLITTGIGLWLIRVPLIMLVTKYTSADVIWVWVIMALDLVSRFVMSFYLMRKRDIFNEYVTS